jgi:hypothetical protein
MSKFRWKGETFAMGQIFEPYLYTPWYYIGSWIFVNTPLLYIVSFLIGLGVAVSRLFRRTLGSWLYKTADERTEVLLIGASLMPIVAVVVLSSTIYDGWRQLYFTYPGMLLLATGMLMRLFAQPMPQQSFGKWLKVGLLGAIALTLAHTGYRMIRLHPYQNVYFNVLAGSRPDQLFDMDYWGVSYRQLLQDLSQQSDIQRPIKVWGKEFSAKINLKMLPVEQRGQFVFVDSLEQADYYLTIFRDRLPNGEYVFPDTLIDRKQPAVEVRTADGIALSAAFKVVR